MQTRDQKYAANIFKQVKVIDTQWPEKSPDESKRKQYGSMAHTLPVLIRSAGLAQALAFVEARGKQPHKDLLDHLAKVIMGETSDGTILCYQSRTAGLSEYRFLTSKAMSALVWYKRFAQSVLDVDASEATNEPED
ncbi:MAG: type III-B CRISPR module-associated protein Cmr5 [bacterium]